MDPSLLLRELLDTRGGSKPLNELLKTLRDEEKKKFCIQCIDDLGAAALFEYIFNEENRVKITALCMEFVAECLKVERLRGCMSSKFIICHIIGILFELAEDDEFLIECELTIQVCRSLGNMACDNDAARERIIRAGGLDVLFKLINLCNSTEAIDERFARIIMGCFFNITNDNVDAHEQLQEMDIIPALIESIEHLPGEAKLHAANALSNLTDIEELQDKFHENKENLVKLLTSVESADVLEVVIESIQTDFNRASEIHKLRYYEVGLWDRLDELANKEPLRKQCMDFMILMLTDDDCMKKMFDAGKGREYQVVKKWLSSECEVLRISGALAIGNFARTDELCLMLLRDSVGTQLISMLSERQSVQVQQAVLSALRNMLIPMPCKQELVQSGILDTLLSILPIESHPVAFKFLGCLRMLADRQQDIAMKLGTNSELLQYIVNWSKVDLHTGVQSEAMRLLCWILKNNSSDKVRITLASGGAIEVLCRMLRSEHKVMQNEAVIAFSLLISGTSPTCVKEAMGKVLPSLCDNITEIIEINLEDENFRTVSHEFLENVVILIINLSISADEFKNILKQKVTRPLQDLNSKTSTVRLKDKAYKALHILTD